MLSTLARSTVFLSPSTLSSSSSMILLSSMIHWRMSLLASIPVSFSSTGRGIMLPSASMAGRQRPTKGSSKAVGTSRRPLQMVSSGRGVMWDAVVMVAAVGSRRMELGVVSSRRDIKLGSSSVKLRRSSRFIVLMAVESLTVGGLSMISTSMFVGLKLLSRLLKALQTVLSVMRGDSTLKVEQGLASTPQVGVWRLEVASFFSILVSGLVSTKHSDAFRRRSFLLGLTSSWLKLLGIWL